MVEIVTGTEKVVAVEVHDPFMVGEVGFDLNMMKLIQKYKISYILKATNANSITMVIWEKDLNKKLLEELQNAYHRITVKKVAIVSALGTNIAMPGALAKATGALYENGINIESVSQSLMQVNMQFVIDRKDYTNAIIAMNKALCLKD